MFIKIEQNTKKSWLANQNVAQLELTDTGILNTHHFFSAKEMFKSKIAKNMLLADSKEIETSIDETIQKGM
ncbi:hypothetical protein [Legionella cincinnatiensis]|uniref:Uncharacterized protein n=1 Tax=Legionella cincinnatiensis TaxID=28085 RepID=A0A378IG60_9GAMM|nr:hypothetical protein [Legionella cincinnatiensis]KTC84345.1 hypothetical protein Lcin_1908 [Legionella cincinnatiensis]STX34023.1 Uncharacterised protein [Legionella cincinnatiensis]